MAITKQTGEIRRCVGSKTYGIAAHDARVSEFPVQPSRKDGLGVMCKTHWSVYTGALRRAAVARKAAAAASAAADAPIRESEAAEAKQQRAAKAKAGASTATPSEAEADHKPSGRKSRTSDATDVPRSVESFIGRNDGNPPIEPEPDDARELPTP
jgi:hypothetical protein